MQSKTKAEALRVIHSCATLYQRNLVHKNLMFIIANSSRALFFETVFLPRNFKHLTGVETKLGASDFYNMAVRDRLAESNFEFSRDGTTNMKLDVLPALMTIHISARMVGEYNNSKSFLVTDKLVGTTSASMGFVKNGEIYIPNTALNTDLRDIVVNPVYRILAILMKQDKSAKYNELTYIAKGMAINCNVFSSIVKERVDLENLTARFPIPRE